MRRFLRTCLDAIIPPHSDVKAAEQIRADETLSRWRLSYLREANTYTALSYRDESVRALIRANKFHHSNHAGGILGAVLGEMLLAIEDERTLAVERRRATLLIPMPASGKRRRERGGNQVEWLIERLSPEVKDAFEYAPRALVRKHRESQTAVPKHKRRENIRGAFSVFQNGRRRTSTILDATVILVDDVIESGATMKDAMRALRASGAKEVIGVALAK